MSTRNLLYDELDDFSKNVIDELESLTKDRDEALRIYNLYLPVLKLLEEGYLEDESFYAEQFFEAYEEGYIPEKWIDKIYSLRGRKIDPSMVEYRNTVQELSAARDIYMIPPVGSQTNVVQSCDLLLHNIKPLKYWSRPHIADTE
ncbi:hypothetical protein [Candidatus Pristimantibacillus sp. PTI5]|uniref:hypothetical protein n=1 Tax=Candidatus Pristimantibacillus sp. PTI5 TaxID=3400422 RepID=UPI003B018A0F